MGHNVQSQAGVTLSDVYDVKGGQAPIERLLTTDVPVVHEMGATIQSERFSQFIRISSVTVNQNENIDILMEDLPAGVSRINGLIVQCDLPVRLTRIGVSLEDTVGQRSMPIWVWDTTNSDEIRVNDGGLGTDIFLRPIPAYTQIPNLITSPDQPQDVNNIACRGLAAGFGAGTVTINLHVFLSFSAIGGIGSRGLPIPSW